MEKSGDQIGVHERNLKWLMLSWWHWLQHQTVFFETFGVINVGMGNLVALVGLLISKRQILKNHPFVSFCWDTLQRATAGSSVNHLKYAIGCYDNNLCKSLGPLAAGNRTRESPFLVAGCNKNLPIHDSIISIRSFGQGIQQQPVCKQSIWELGLPNFVCKETRKLLWSSRNIRAHHPHRLLKVWGTNFRIQTRVKPRVIIEDGATAAYTTPEVYVQLIVRDPDNMCRRNYKHLSEPLNEWIDHGTAKLTGQGRRVLVW